MDVHVRRAVTEGLRLRGVDVLTSQDDGTRRFSDPDLLNRAAELGRLLFTQDDDLLREAHLRQATGTFFAGLIFAHQLNISVGRCISDLELIAVATSPEEWHSQTVYLPL